MKVILIINILLMLAMAICLDLKTGRIPNSYNLCWMIYGMLYSLLFIPDGFWSSILGIGIPLIGLMLIFKLGALGAGDIKLFMALGSFLGLQVVSVIVYSFLFCALYGVLRVATRTIRLIRENHRINGLELLMASLRGNTRVAFSVFIGLGFVGYVIKSAWGGG